MSHGGMAERTMNLLEGGKGGWGREGGEGREGG